MRALESRELVNETMEELRSKLPVDSPHSLEDLVSEWLAQSLRELNAIKKRNLFRSVHKTLRDLMPEDIGTDNARVLNTVVAGYVEARTRKADERASNISNF